jgi:hypothetical protein
MGFGFKWSLVWKFYGIIYHSLSYVEELSSIVTFKIQWRLAGTWNVLKFGQKLKLIIHLAELYTWQNIQHNCQMYLRFQIKFTN